MQHQQANHSSTNHIDRTLKHRFFVYGTLKKGEPNHHHFHNAQNGKITFVSKGHSVIAFPLVIATRWNLPFLVYAPGKGHVIEGEIYDVDDDMLNFMDDFEGHPEVYERDRVKVTLTGKESTGKKTGNAFTMQTECWTYFLKNFPTCILEKKALPCYEAYGDHGKPYSEDKDLSGPDTIYEALQDDV